MLCCIIKHEEILCSADDLFLLQRPDGRVLFSVPEGDDSDLSSAPEEAVLAKVRRSCHAFAHLLHVNIFWPGHCAEPLVGKHVL